MSGKHAMRVTCFVILAYSAAQVYAAEPALLRASVAKPGPVLVGEHVTMIVELLTVTTFASTPVFELPKIPGAILMQLEERPVLGTEEIDGETYTVQRHELALFVMRPGVAQISPFTVRFESSRRFGEKPIEYHLTTPALQVEARMPPGAENYPGLVATRELHVEQVWHPQPRKARVGDAFTRTVTLTAPDLPGMVFPPLPLAEVEGSLSIRNHRLCRIRSSAVTSLASAPKPSHTSVSVPASSPYRHWSFRGGISKTSS
jgi:hypothetical protein